MPVFVTGTNNKISPDDKQFTDLKRFVEKGGSAIYIEGAKKTIEEKSTVFPFTAKVHPGRGLWTCIPHLVHKHKIFSGLPSNTMMRNIYENVWATSTLRNINGEGNPETIVGTVAFDWFSKGHKMHYSGPGESWWGSDIAVIPTGKGKCVVSQLRLINNLGKDPVADKILFNMIDFFAKK